MEVCEKEKKINNVQVHEENIRSFIKSSFIAKFLVNELKLKISWRRINSEQHKMLKTHHQHSTKRYFVFRLLQQHELFLMLSAFQSLIIQQ
ncbi:CLUMA_CG004291, isoform A [Clunio marinus]|uniref:CLUMA_CG004291, isoform A n=1 Tax=Clunio marinus TaxID=568069 RepID=A0A1J1HRE0_9DIPT|nr:CLUMA_CG004291, isoform A [Clunio marinus]